MPAVLQDRDIFLRFLAAAKQNVTGWGVAHGLRSCDKAAIMRISARNGPRYGAPRQGITGLGIKPMNDNDERPVTIIIGRVRRSKTSRWEGVHVLLAASDDDTAARKALDALASEGYAEAELDQIGDMEGEPDEEPHLSAWQGALEGEVSIVMVKGER